MADRVSDYLAQWAAVRPDLDVSSMGVVGRISRAGEILGRAVSENFREHGIQSGEFDTLATLRRSEAPHTLTPGQLARSAMVSGAAMTNRLQRLEDRGLLERATDPDNRRSVRVRLTEAGLEVVDAAVATHVATQQQALDQALTPREQAQLADLLERFLEGSGDNSADPG